MKIRCGEESSSYTGERSALGSENPRLGGEVEVPGACSAHVLIRIGIRMYVWTSDNGLVRAGLV